MQGGEPPQSKNPSNREKTWTDMMLAPRPTPQIGRPDGVPVPAAMPAAGVAWQQPSSSSRQYTPAPEPISPSAPLRQNLVHRLADEVENPRAFATFHASISL